MLRFILASASARRRELLSGAGYDFDAAVSGIDEQQFLQVSTGPADFACRAALAKAKDVSRKFADRLVVGADTIADYDGEIIGKAGSAREAAGIIKKLFSKPHKIITAVAFVYSAANFETVEFDTTIIYPKAMTAEQIASHIESESWRDRAGAYSFQENGDEFVEKINGSDTNVVGLPMELFEEMFKRFELRYRD